VIAAAIKASGTATLVPHTLQPQFACQITNDLARKLSDFTKSPISALLSGYKSNNLNWLRSVCCSDAWISA
jgi:hypothetical protein